MTDIIGRAKVIVESVVDSRSIDKSGSKIGNGLRRASVVGVAALGAIAAESIRASLAFEEAESKQRKLNNTLANMGKAGAVGELNKLSDALMRKTGVDDEVIKSGQTILATFSEVAKSAGEVGGAFDRASALSLDLAATGFGSVDSASKALGKALQDPTKGVTALNKAGVTFTATQKEQIKNFIRTGDVASAQNLILKEVKKQVGGNAEAGAKGSDKLRTAFGELEESFGHVLDTFAGGDDGYARLADRVNDIADAVDRFADSPGLKNFLKVTDLGAEPPAGTGTVLAPGTENVRGPLQEALDAQAEQAGASWWEKFLASWEADEQQNADEIKDFLEKVFGDAEFTPSDIPWIGYFWEKGQAFKDDKWFSHLWDDIVGFFDDGWEALKIGFSDTWDDVKSGAEGLLQDLKHIDWVSAGEELIGDFISGIANGGFPGGAVSKIAHKIKDAINDSLPDEITFFGGKGGIPAITVPLPQLASGARNFAGGLALVGERGPELVNLPAGSDVYSNRETAAMGSFTYAPQYFGPVSGSDILAEYKWANRFAPRFGALTATVAG